MVRNPDLGRADNSITYFNQTNDFIRLNTGRVNGISTKIGVEIIGWALTSWK
jgi:hypothetical protein